MKKLRNILAAEGLTAGRLDREEGAAKRQTMALLRRLAKQQGWASWGRQERGQLVFDTGVAASVAEEVARKFLVTQGFESQGDGHFRKTLRETPFEDGTERLRALVRVEADDDGAEGWITFYVNAQAATPHSYFSNAFR
jgi:hypothetical protein